MNEKQEMMLRILDGTATSKIKKELSASLPYEYTDGEVTLKIKCINKATLSHEGCFIEATMLEMAKIYFALITDGDLSKLNYEEITYDEYCS